MIGLGSGIKDVADFNRRAMIALKAVSFGESKATSNLVDGVRRMIDRGDSPSLKQQRALYEIVRRYRKQISDSLVIDYAESNSKGYYA